MLYEKEDLVIDSSFFFAQSRKTLENKTDGSADEATDASRFSDHQPPFEDEQGRTEFVANVKVRCEKILKQVRPPKGIDATDVKQAREGSRKNLSEEKSFLESVGKMQSPFVEMDEGELLRRRIGKRLDRIMELVRQKVS